MKHAKTEQELEEVGSEAIRDLLRCLPGTKVTQLAEVSPAGATPSRRIGSGARHADVDLALGTKSLGDGEYGAAHRAA